MIRGPERSAVSAATARRFACWAALLAVAAGLIGGRVSASALALRPEDRLARLPYGVGGGYAEDQEAAQGELPCRDRAAGTRTCKEMGGAGSFDTLCVIASSASISGDVCVHGAGSVEIRAGVRIACPVPGCYLVFNVSGSITVGERSELVAGSIGLHAANVSLGRGSAVNTTGLAGAPPPQTSGTPHSLEGAGGGHGGRGASCKVSNDTNWGGDVYAWAFLDNPWSYGSKGGSLSVDERLGGHGGGRVLLRASGILTVDGVVLAEGGMGSLREGGGSGGSIMIKAFKL